MTNRITLLLAFLAAFMFITPTVAAPPEEGAKVEEAKAPAEAEAPKPEETKAPAEAAKAEEAKAPATIESDEEAVSILQQLVGAAKGGHWPLVVAFGLMVVMYLLNKIGIVSKLGPKAIPWVAAATGIAGYVSAGLMVEGATVADGVTSGIMTGAAAVGLWEMLFKHFLGAKKSPAKAEGES
jgi:hypothetical protein